MDDMIFSQDLMLLGGLLLIFLFAAVICFLSAWIGEEKIGGWIIAILITGFGLLIPFMLAAEYGERLRERRLRLAAERDRVNERTVVVR